MKILVTGAAGFIDGYLVPDLLEAGHEVIGLDDFSKYGRLAKSYDDHPRYQFVEGDAKDAALMTELAADCDQVVAAAAMIGGITYFHQFAYDLLAENERIVAATFDVAIDAHRDGHLEQITVMSSSMVYESATVFPTPEGDQLTCPPPISTYGFQKLASEYFAKGALEQYGLPYTIVRPFNCVGIGERRALRDTDIMSGNVKLALFACCPGPRRQGPQEQDPLHILGDGSQVRALHVRRRHRRGIRMALESPKAITDDFNLSTATSTTVLELAECIWSKVHGDGRRSNYCPTRRSNTTSSSACPTSASPRTSSASRPRPPRDDARRSDPRSARGRRRAAVACGRTVHLVIVAGSTPRPTEATHI